MEEEKGLDEKILEAGKQKAEDAIKDEVKKGAKKVGMQIAKVVAKVIASVLPTIMPIIVAITLVVGVLSFFTTQSEITAKAGEINETTWSIIKIGDNGPVIPSASKVIETINEQLEKLGISRSSLEMGNDSQTDFYLYKYMAAYLSTQLPYIENSNAQTLTKALKDLNLDETTFEAWADSNEELILQGIVKIKRRTNDNIKDLTFKNHDDFIKLVDENKSEALNYFSISDDWQLCLAKYTSTTTTTTDTSSGETTSLNYTVDEVKIPYQTMISQYAVPFEFLLTLEQMTANPEYVSAVADLILDQGEIELTIFDSIETVTNDYTYTSTLNSKGTEEVEVENDDGTTETKPEPGSSSISKTIHTVTVTKINTITANVTKADVWVIKQNVEYTKNNTIEYPLGENGITNDLGSEEEPPGDTGSWETGKSETTKETIEKEEWQQTGDSKIEIAESKFLGLWKNSSGKYEEGAEYDPNGKVVKYYQPAKKKYDSPVQNIDSDAEMLCTILEQNETTQRHAQLMRYLIHYYKTGEKLDIDLDIFNTNEFSGVTEIAGGTIQEKVWFALIGAGFSEESAAGAMGNIHYESSGFNPNAIEGGYTETTGGIGICQWTNNNRGTQGRNTNLRNYATSRGTTWQDENIQVQYLLTEITGKGDATGFASCQFMTTTNDRYGRMWYKDEWEKAEGSTTDEKIENATKAFCYTFERPATSAASTSIGTRIQYAKMYYKQFHGKEAPSGDYSGDVVRYYQGDYKDVPYGSGTISSCGCGPTSFAMVATQLSGKTITPKDAVAWCGNTYYTWAYKNGVKTGAGTSWTYFAAAAKHFKLNCNIIQTGDFTRAQTALQNGKLVICSQGPGLFTDGGHFIVLTKMVQGKIYVNDPNKNNAVNKGYNNRAFTISEITAAAKQYWIFD